MVSVIGSDKVSKAAVKKFASLFPQQLSAEEVDFCDQRLAGKSEITDGGKVVKIHIAIAGFLQGDLSLAQVLVLQLQFDLVHLEFMQEFLSSSNCWFQRPRTSQSLLSG